MKLLDINVLVNGFNRCRVKAPVTLVQYQFLNVGFLFLEYFSINVVFFYSEINKFELQYKLWKMKQISHLHNNSK